jgi:hypothetical protein
MTRPDEVFPLDSPKDRRPWARVADPQAPLGFREMQSGNEMVNLWSTLGFVVETTSDGAPKDLYSLLHLYAASLDVRANHRGAMTRPGGSESHPHPTLPRGIRARQREEISGA